MLEICCFDQVIFSLSSLKMPHVINGRLFKISALSLDHVSYSTVSHKKFLSDGHDNDFADFWCAGCFRRQLSGSHISRDKLIAPSDILVLQKRTITWSQLLASTDKGKTVSPKKKGKEDEKKEISQKDNSIIKHDAIKEPILITAPSEEIVPVEGEKLEKGKEGKGIIHFCIKIVQLFWCS